MTVSSVDSSTALAQALASTASTDDTSSTSGSTSTGSSTSTNSSSSSDSSQSLFLSLLTAQLKYQDPNNTTDPSQLITQTAMFEQLSQLSSMANTLSSVYTNQTNYGASSLVGKTAKYTNSAGDTASGTISGVTFSSAGPQFTIGSDTVAMAKLLSVGTTSSTSTT